MNKFEQLIEYVINDEEQKARELFHDIVVEKSRQIYEEMMDQEEEVEESIGGDQSDDLIDDIEVEEEGLSEEGEEDFEAEEEFGDAEGGEEVEMDLDTEEGGEDLEDRVVDLEDKLDELMAEFESLMGDEAPADDELDAEMDVDMEAGDELGDEMSDEEIEDDELETEGMMENVSLKAVAKPSNTEEASNKKSPVAANSGAKGAMAKPVSTSGDGGTGRPAPTAKELIGKVGNSPAQSTQKPTPAPKAQTSQASGVNTKSVIQ